MKARSFGAAATLLALFAAPAGAGGKPEPKTSVKLAKSWDAAVEEAKALDLPIVVHSHGFFCGPCWGMHDSVMCNKEFVKFAEENTVEVISLDRLEEGVEKKDRRAETYDVKVDGEKVSYLVEFPGLTVEDMKALHASHAATYNQTGKIPYTCLVDPYTLEELEHWSGATSASTIEDSITTHRKAMEKEHGKVPSRKEWRLLASAEDDAKAKAAKNDFSKALEALAKASQKSDKWPEEWKSKLAASKEEVVAAAKAALDAIESAKDADAPKAKKDLTALVASLKGTGLEERAKTLLATL